MSSPRKPLPGETARRWLARLVSPNAMENIFDPFIADLQSEWIEAMSTRSIQYARWSLLAAYLSLAAQVAIFATGSLFGPPHALAPVAESGTMAVDAGISEHRGPRYIAPLALSALITFGLFTVMSGLIAKQPGKVPTNVSVPIRIVPLENDPEPPVDLKPEFPERPPLILKPNVDGISVVDPTTPIDVTRLEPTGEVFGTISLGRRGSFEFERGADHGEMPIFTIPPAYPRRALERGVSGWVEVEYTVTETGSVANPIVLRSHPSSIFDSAALRAIERWKYEPKVVDGRPVSRPGVRKRLRFELGDSVARRD